MFSAFIERVNGARLFISEAVLWSVGMKSTTVSFVFPHLDTATFREAPLQNFLRKRVFDILLYRAANGSSPVRRIVTDLNDELFGLLGQPEL